MADRPSSPTAAPLPPVLTLHRMGGIFVLRTFGPEANSLAVGIAKMIAGEAEALIITTPLDTKMFQFGNNQTVQRPSQAVPGPIPNEEEEDTMAAAARLAEEAERDEEAAGLTPSRQAPPVETDDSGNEIVGETPQGTKVVRRKKKPATVTAGASAPCRRCVGRGTIPIIVEGGNAGEGICPVCKGKRTVTQYGAAPARRR